MCDEQEQGDQSGRRRENWEPGSESRSRPWDLGAVAKAFDLLLSDVESWEGVCVERDKIAQRLHDKGQCRDLRGQQQSLRVRPREIGLRA